MSSTCSVELIFDPAAEIARAHAQATRNLAQLVKPMRVIFAELKAKLVSIKRSETMAIVWRVVDKEE